MSFRLAKRLLLVILIMLGIILSQKYSHSADVKTQGNVETVKTDQVCMVNDTVMGKPQIPVVVEGKTYYGCCEGCVARLKKNRSLRFSNDSVTGKEVDKAKAFITAEPNGSALYFESRETAEKYMANDSPAGGIKNKR